MKTPEQMAREYGITRELFDPHRITVYIRTHLEQGFLAGYRAARDQLADAGKVMNSPEKQDSCEHILDMEKMVDVNSLNNSNGWISVKERLPKNDEFVLIYQPEAGSWVSSHDESGWGMWENGLTCKPTHWMPLPEPPKGEG